MIIAVYTDGGVIGANPSQVGGTWCYCVLDETGQRVGHQCGVVTPADVGLPTVSNNMTELLAILYAMESLPNRWDGDIYTDSMVSLLRCKRRYCRKPASMNGIPDAFVQRLDVAKNRLGSYRIHLLDGHPTQAQLKAGRGKRGHMVSVHNVFCDKVCSTVGKKFVQERNK